MADRAGQEAPRLEEISAWLTRRVSELANLAPDSVDAREEFVRYGLDSAAAVELIGDLEDWLGCALPTTLAWDFPTVEKMAAYLADLEQPDGEP
jgi:acyl carrier protein